VLLSPGGKTVERKAVHGTVTRHNRQYQQDKQTLTNPVAAIFAWTRGLICRRGFDKTPDVVTLAETLEKACVETVESTFVTRDLAILISADLVDEHPGVPRKPDKNLTMAVP